jgi:hypothetical protein
MQQVLVHEPNYARWIMACDTKVMCMSYWHDIEVIHIGYCCAEHELPYGVDAHAKYGCTCSNLYTQSHLDGVQ